MANHGAAAALLIASLLVAVALADARLTAVHRGTFGGYAVADAVVICGKVHAVRAGETCFAVAQAAGLTLEKFLGFNPNINCQNVFVGQWVCVGGITF